MNREQGTAAVAELPTAAPLVPTQHSLIPLVELSILVPPTELRAVLEAILQTRVLADKMLVLQARDLAQPRHLL